VSISVATPTDLLLDALAGRNRGRPPVWLMRQAGRYMAEYRALRERHAFEEMCREPEIAVRVSLLPHEILDVDVVIVFSDILLPLAAMGAPLEYTDEGPALTRPIRDARGLERLGELDPETGTPAILESIRKLREVLAGTAKPVLGFAGAPFTLAAYLLEGRIGARGAEAVARAAHAAPAFLHQLLGRLAAATAVYLRAQVEAGAHAFQLFDTWAGRLDAARYREFALPYQRRVFDAVAAVRPEVPGILFVRDSSHLVEAMAESGARCLSLDWRAPLGAARRALGPAVALQGNLDPAVLFGPAEVVRRQASEILEDRRGDPGFVFNLGHGVLPETPVESARALVETVKGFR
jgi:uroporphyrinogen decarboxylase